MSNMEVARAWRNPEYRASLSAAQLSVLPASPAGPLELNDGDLDVVAGGATLTPRCSSCLNCTDTSSWAFSCQTS